MKRRPEVVRKDGEHPIELNVNPRAIVLGIVILLAVLWFVRGGPAYTVAPDEEGVVLTFGKYTKTAQPGFHLKWPWPIQTVETPKVTETKRLEFGFRSVTRGGSTTYTSFDGNSEMLHEARMLTGDENVVDCSMVVQFYIRDSLEYLFNFRPGDVESALRDVGEAALRQAVGDHPIDDVLTRNKFQVQDEIKQKMQELADLYKMGVTIGQVQLQDVQPPSEVANAFKQVASAREEREQIINVAQAYAREAVPKAEGEAARVKLEADAYKEARVAEAQGAVSRFLAIAKEYKSSPEVTRTRMYLEALEEVLPKMKLTVVDKEAGIVNLKALGGGGVSASPGVARRGEQP